MFILLFSTDEEISSPKTYTYLPFAVGPRSCIGSRFALTEMKVVLAKILQKFNLSIATDHPKLHTVQSLTMKPKPTPTLKISLVK